MGHTTMKRTIAAVVAGAALVLTSAGACGPTATGDDDNPGVSNQQDGDDDGGDGDGDGGDDD